jgi:hypothetical protein
MLNTVVAILIASMPGTSVFLFSHWFNWWRERGNTRTMLRLEIDANWTALQAFWQGINGLDTDDHDGKSHLEAMAVTGLFKYPAPQWSWLRWQGLE